MCTKITLASVEAGEVSGDHGEALGAGTVVLITTLLQDLRRVLYTLT